MRSNTRKVQSMVHGASEWGPQRFNSPASSRTRSNETVNHKHSYLAGSDNVDGKTDSKRSFHNHYGYITKWRLLCSAPYSRLDKAFFDAASYNFNRHSVLKDWLAGFVLP